MKLLQVAREMGRLESKIVCLQKENEILQRQVNGLTRRTDTQLDIMDSIIADVIRSQSLILVMHEQLVRRGIFPPAMSDE